MHTCPTTQTHTYKRASPSPRCFPWDFIKSVVKGLLWEKGHGLMYMQHAQTHMHKFVRSIAANFIHEICIVVRTHTWMAAAGGLAVCRSLEHKNIVSSLSLWILSTDYVDWPLTSFQWVLWVAIVFSVACSRKCFTDKNRSCMSW